LKTDISDDDFLALLDSIAANLRVLVGSKQYHQLSNNEYYGNADITLIDALQGVEQTHDTYSEMIQNNLASISQN
jgi:hypothetical protein